MFTTNIGYQQDTHMCTAKMVKNIDRELTYLHGVKRAGETEECGESNETEGHQTCTDLELNKVADVMVDTLALLYGWPA